MLYFAYGSNMDWVQMKGRCPSAKFVCTAELPGHILDFPRKSEKRHCGVADVKESPGYSVWGVVYEIREKDIPTLNACEGCQPNRAPDKNAYNPLPITVLRDGNQEELLDVILYKAVPKEPGKPSKAYMELIVCGAKFWHLPDDYIQELEKNEVMP